MQIDQLRDLLRRKYTEVRKELSLSVSVMYRVAILGGVQRPGLYFIDSTHSFSELVALAGGLTENAKPDGIKVIRANGQAVPFDAGAVLNGETTLDNLALQSGDRVVVPTGRRFGLYEAFLAVQSIAVVVTLLTR